MGIRILVKTCTGKRSGYKAKDFASTNLPTEDRCVIIINFYGS